MVSAFSFVAAINASEACFQLAGKSPAIRRLNSAASAGKALAYASNLAFHSVSNLAPLAF